MHILLYSNNFSFKNCQCVWRLSATSHLLKVAFSTPRISCNTCKRKKIVSHKIQKRFTSSLDNWDMKMFSVCVYI